MGRPEIKGLKYFPLDVGFFRDRKIRLLRGEHGANGIEVYQRIVCRCYEEDNGYFLVWDDDEDFVLLADETGLPDTKLRAIMATLLRRSLLCKLTLRGNATSPREDHDTLAEAGNGNDLTPSVTVLTSRGIQRRYFDIIKDAKIKAAADGRHTTIQKGLCLLTEQDFSELNKTHVWLKVAHNQCFSGNNNSNSENNPDKSENNPANEIKENKSNTTCESAGANPTQRELDDFFENIWKSYPNKKGKGQVSKTQRRKLFKIGPDELARCIERYKSTKPDWQQWQNGSTFFNSGYIDFLDANFETELEIKASPKQRVRIEVGEDGNEYAVWEDINDG